MLLKIVVIYTERKIIAREVLSCFSIANIYTDDKKKKTQDTLSQSQ